MSALIRTWSCLVCAFCLVADDARADWPQFRGVNSSGVAVGESPPVEFGPGKNEIWRLPLDVGHSSPCIVGDKIFLTTFKADQKQLCVVCIDRTTGKMRWERTLSAEAIERGHPSFNPASSSPASDDERVVAYFGSFGLICFDIHGEKLWEKRMPLAKTFGGNAASPVIVGHRVILYRGTYDDHYLLALDKRTGKQLWKVPQHEKVTGEMACTACPIVVGEKLIVHSARSIQAVDIASGKQIWIAKCATTATSTPILAGNEVIVAAWNKMGEPALRPPFPGFEKMLDEHDENEDDLISRDEFPTLWIFHRPDGAEAPQNGAAVRFEWADKNKDGEINASEWSTQVADLERHRSQYVAHGILAIPLDSDGVVQTDAIRTLETQSIPEVPSPLTDGTFVYIVKNGGVLTCLELKTGNRVYRMRTRGQGTHYASPLIADGKLFATAGDGHISVLTLGPKPKILATNDMREHVYATPAIVDGTIYVRTHSALYAFGKTNDR